MSVRSSSILVLVFTSRLFAGVYTYECEELPEPAGWTLIQNWCGAQQWVAVGGLFQHVELCRGFANGQFIDQQRLIENLQGATAWFAEWRMSTDGISEEIPAVAPAALVLFDGDGLLYHFTIADDRVRLIRDLELPILYFDIEPGVHTYRVELFGENLDSMYRILIDGIVVDQGIPEGPFHNPPWEAGVIFRAKATLAPNTATWSYIRWGDIGSGGDFNLDGMIDSFDLFYFQECLSDPQGAGSWPGCTWADMNSDGSTTCDDWDLFVAAWTDPADPPTVPQCDCPTDITTDGTTNAFDLAQLLGAWGPNPTHPADFTDDGTINASDLALLLGAWGPCQ